MVIENNFNMAFNSYDAIELFNFPEYLTAYKLSITINVDPGGINEAGVFRRMTDALAT